MCPTNKKTNSQCVCHCFVVVTVSGNFFRKNLLMRKKGSWCSALPTESSLNVPLENSIPLKWEPDRVLYLLMVIMWCNLEHWDIFRVTGENAGKHIKNGYDVYHQANLILQCWHAVWNYTLELLYAALFASLRCPILQNLCVKRATASWNPVGNTDCMLLTDICASDLWTDRAYIFNMAALLPSWR